MNGEEKRKKQMWFAAEDRFKPLFEQEPESVKSNRHFPRVRSIARVQHVGWVDRFFGMLQFEMALQLDNELSVSFHTDFRIAS